MDEPVPHSVIHTTFLDDVEEAELVVMCRGIRLIIQVHGRDMREDSSDTDSPWASEFQHFLQDRDDDPHVLEEFEEWALEPFLDFMKASAPSQVPESLTLMDYYAPRTFLFRLASKDGALVPQPYGGTPADTRLYDPRVDLSDLPRSALLISQVPRIEASDVMIVPEADPDSYEYCSIPHTVTRPYSPEWVFFKAALDMEELDHELFVYASCRQQGSTCVPRLIALVEWPLGGGIMGFLTAHIDKAGTLADEGPLASLESRRKWMDQIETAIEQLHSIGCYWGDVKPENVLIGTEGDAHVIDFGGGFSNQWVDQELAGSREGDLQGIARICDFLEL